MKKTNKRAGKITLCALTVSIVILITSVLIHGSVMRKKYTEMVSYIKKEYSSTVSDISQKYNRLRNDADCCLLYNELVMAGEFTGIYRENLIEEPFDIKQNHESEEKYLKLTRYDRNLSFDNWLLIGELSTSYQDMLDYLDNMDIQNSDYYKSCMYDYFGYIYNYRNFVIDIAVEGRKAGDDQRDHKCEYATESDHYITQSLLLNRLINDYDSGNERELAASRYLEVLNYVEEFIDTYNKELNSLENAEKDSAKKLMNDKLQSIAKYS